MLTTPQKSPDILHRYYGNPATQHTSDHMDGVFVVSYVFAPAWASHRIGRIVGIFQKQRMAVGLYRRGGQEERRKGLVEIGGSETSST